MYWDGSSSFSMVWKVSGRLSCTWSFEASRWTNRNVSKPSKRWKRARSRTLISIRKQRMTSRSTKVGRGEAPMTETIKWSKKKDQQFSMIFATLEASAGLEMRWSRRPLSELLLPAMRNTYSSNELTNCISSRVMLGERSPSSVQHEPLRHTSQTPLMINQWSLFNETTRWKSILCRRLTTKRSFRWKMIPRLSRQLSLKKDHHTTPEKNPMGIPKRLFQSGMCQSRNALSHIDRLRWTREMSHRHSEREEMKRHGEGFLHCKQQLRHFQERERMCVAKKRRSRSLIRTWRERNTHRLNNNEKMLEGWVHRSNQMINLRICLVQDALEQNLLNKSFRLEKKEEERNRSTGHNRRYQTIRSANTFVGQRSNELVDEGEWCSSQSGQFL